MSKNIRFTKNNLYAIINQNSRESMINMEIVKYKPEYKNDFIRLSKNWITKYFALESDHFEVFENIDKLIKNERKRTCFSFRNQTTSVSYIRIPYSHIL